MFTVKKEPRESVVFVMDTATDGKLMLFDSMSTAVGLASSRRHQPLLPRLLDLIS